MELNEATQRGENPLAIQRAEAARAAMTLDKAHQAYIAAIRRGDRKKLRPRTIGDKQGIYDRLADGLPRKVAQDFDTKQNGQTPSARLLTNVAHTLAGAHPSGPSSTVERQADGRQSERHEEALNNREESL
ncbi:hypothetical protein [Sphingobium yanoikuyae]|uniref:hypothetical protein n=1 Tax=Sphingobium yanoikuyae TaxID=13690 RepID=UPI0022DD2441|nr:hypothetical protein [Sphingobium yanoikuyae]WBQ17825.1 hypothetical protein PAE53_06390 [Sphingobium yanoikuyae]